LEGIAFGFDPVTGMLPLSGPGMAVTFNGLPAPLYYASATQINAQVPATLSGAAEARVAVTVLGQTSNEVTLPVGVAAPGLFPRVWNQDGSLNSAEVPAARGSIIVAFATGTGPGTAISLRIGGLDAELLYAGPAPGTQGVVQINARLPDAARGSAEIELRSGGVASQPGVVVAITSTETSMETAAAARDTAPGR
jgi:uncharacterized protein (TIGR03437 family)